MGLSLRPLGRKITDVFSADTQEDQQRRIAAGQPRLYADQQRAMGNQRPATNPGAALLGNAARLANTAKAGVGGLYGLGKIGISSVFGNDQDYARTVAGVEQTLRRDEAPNAGLFGAGTFFDDFEQASKPIAPLDLAKTIVAGGAGTAGEVLPVGRGLSVANQGMRVLPKITAQGAAMGALGGAGDEFIRTGQVDPGNVALSAATGGVLAAAPPVITAGAKQLPRVAKKGAEVVRAADEKAFTPAPARLSDNELYTLSDFADYKMGRNKNPGDLNGLMQGARATAKKLGVDITSGSPEEVNNRIADAMEQAVALRGARQGGYVKLPRGNAAPGVENPKPAVSARSSGGKQRGFVTSVKGSPEVSSSTKQATQGTYDVRSTSTLQGQAEKFAGGNLKKAKTDLDQRLNVPEGRITDREVADTIALAKRLDDTGSFEDASGLYSKLAAHLTKQGQSIQAASLLARRTPEGLQYHARKTLDKAGVKLSPEKQKRLQELVNKVRKTKPETEERNRAVYDVTKFVNDQIPASITDKAVNLWRAGLLTAPTTTAGNITGNLGEAVARKGFVNPVATAADAAMSLVTGKRTQTLAPAGSGVEGAKIGAKKLPDFLKSGYDERNILSKYDAKAINYGDSPAGKIATAYVNGVYRLMGTADQPFYYSAHRNALGSIAKAEAINARIPSNQRADWVKNFMDNPPKGAQERAAQEAAYAVFQNKTGLGQAAQAFKRGLNKLTPGLGDFIVPFTQVPASIATRVITRTPIGTAVEVVKQFKKVKDGGNFDQRAMAQAIGEGAFGVAVLGAGYSLANSGFLTFGYPKDQKERKLWETEGKQPYSIRIGDRWYSFNYLQPFGTLLAVGAKAGEQIESGKSPVDALSVAAGTAGQSIANQSFIKGVSAAIDTAVDPERNATKFLNQTGASLVPNLVRATARSFDPLQREPAGFVEGIKQGIPGLREQTVAKNDIFGQPLSAKDTPANQLLNPLRPSRARDTDPVLREMRRLQDDDLGKIPSQINKASLGKDTVLNKDQIRDLQANVGVAVKDAWSQVIETPEYGSLTDEDKSKLLGRISRDVLAVEKYKYAEVNQIGELKDLTTKQRAILDGAFSPDVYTQVTSAKKKVTKKASVRRATARGRGGKRSSGSVYKYSVSPSAGGDAAGAKVAVKKIARPKIRSKARSGSQNSRPKVAMKKSRV